MGLLLTLLSCKKNGKGFIKIQYYRVSPLYLWVPHPWMIQPPVDHNYLEKEIPESCKKQSLNLLHWQPFPQYLNCIYNYSHNIYIVLGVTSNLGLIQYMWQDELYANTLPFYKRDLGFQIFWYSWVGRCCPGTNLPPHKRNHCIPI